MSTSSRDLILRALRVRGKCTVKDLADAAGISPVSVRHHLSNLQAEGLVTTEEVRHGVGRPRLLFALTERALELFPSRYYRLTRRLLGEIKGSLPSGTVSDLFSGVAEAMADDYADRLAGLPLAEKLQRLVELLSEEGFAAEIEARGDELLIHELSCPYFMMGKVHPEVCLVDQAFIARALSLPVERVTCLLEGESRCTFAVGLEHSLQGASPHG
ncbi:MAG: ArsR family transcriptional regulator [Chloroflexota bacterium]